MQSDTMIDRGDRSTGWHPDVRSEHVGAPSVSKVVGLGAPLSLRIRFEGVEASLVREVLQAQVDAHEQAGAVTDEEVPPRGDDDWAVWRAELRRMLGGLVRDGDSGDRPLEVVWPTVVAHDVVGAAVREAAERLRDTLSHAEQTAASRAAACIYLACLETWDALRAVDSGGLQDVWLRYPGT